ncbi:MAG: N-acetylmuramoyl-L-alanine amidase [Candidatus Cloacimonetes bacterium]|nr:N-acetylmuramoyl-L-alanine amidase [Candidatus Cloacimonadota bacterium]
MKQLLILLIALLLLSSLPALERIRVEYRDDIDPDYINISYIDNIPYLNIQELNKTLNAFIYINVIDRRIYLDLYEERLIFMLDSSFLLHRADLYNYIYSMVFYQGRYYVPLVLVQNVLPLVLSDKLQFDKTTQTLYAESPVDTSFRVIVIDPGHGGKDPGAVNRAETVRESDIVLTVSKKLKKLIEDNLDVEVYLTREDNRGMSLFERTNFANRKNANLFISIHCNAAKNRSASGIEVYFLSPAKTEEALAVEILENRVVELYEGGEEAVRRYSTLDYILDDMLKAEQIKESSYLAFRLQGNLVKATGAKDRGVKQAGFHVLKGAHMPSVLVELGFISNLQEEKKLVDPAYQQKLAEAMLNGIRSYIYNYEMFR